MYYVIHMHIHTVYMLYTCCIHSSYIMTLGNPGLPSHASHDANARSALRAADSCEHRWALSTAKLIRGRRTCELVSLLKFSAPCMMQRWENHGKP